MRPLSAADKAGSGEGPHDYAETIKAHGRASAETDL